MVLVIFASLSIGAVLVSLPATQARVNPSTGTPRNATFVTMFTAGLLALLFDIEVLAELVSIGTLVVFTMVCGGVLYR